MSENGVFAVARSIWADPDFADEQFTEREAWMWLIGEGFVRNHPRILSAAWKWPRQRVLEFVRKMRARGLFIENGGYLYGVSLELAQPHTEFISGQSWRSLRLRVLARDLFCCAYCGGRASHVDHVFPRSRGGLDVESNLVAACEHCNLSKGDRTLEEWRIAI